MKRAQIFGVITLIIISFACGVLFHKWQARNRAEHLTKRLSEQVAAKTRNENNVSMILTNVPAALVQLRAGLEKVRIPYRRIEVSDHSQCIKITLSNDVSVLFSWRGMGESSSGSQEDLILRLERLACILRDRHALSIKALDMSGN